MPPITLGCFHLRFGPTSPGDFLRQVLLPHGMLNHTGPIYEVGFKGNL